MRQRETPPNQADLQRHVRATYTSLRMGLAVILAALPFSMLIAGALSGVGPQASMSAYYWAGEISNPPGRIWLIGGLFAMAAFLYLYKGFTKRENWALNVAGLSALVTAYFPMAWNCGPDNKPIKVDEFSYCVAGWNPHVPSAVLMFACFAYVTFFRAHDTLPALPTPQLQRRFRNLYRTASLAMVAGPLAIAVIYISSENFSTPVFWLEAAVFLAFAAHWAIKGAEMGISSASERAARGEGLPAASPTTPTTPTH